MFRAMKLRQKEVINITDARRLGFVHDVEINENDGSLEAIIVPRRRPVRQDLRRRVYHTLGLHRGIGKGCCTRKTV